MDPNDSLLNLDGPPDEPPATPPPAEPGAAAAVESPPVPKPNELAELKESNKQLQEQMRQMTENNKPVQEFFDKLTGNADNEAKKAEARQLLLEYEADPVKVTQDLIDKKLISVNETIMQTVASSKVDKAMESINKVYDVDWVKERTKIVTQLATFSDAAKKADPTGTLVAALKLAGLDKAKNTVANTPPVVPDSTKRGVRMAPKSVEDDVNNRLNNVGNRKKNNVFGIPDKK